MSPGSEMLTNLILWCINKYIASKKLMTGERQNCLGLLSQLKDKSCVTLNPHYQKYHPQKIVTKKQCLLRAWRSLSVSSFFLQFETTFQQKVGLNSQLVLCAWLHDHHCCHSVSASAPLQVYRLTVTPNILLSVEPQRCWCTHWCFCTTMICEATECSYSKLWDSHVETYCATKMFASATHCNDGWIHFCWLKATRRRYTLSWWQQRISR